MYDICPVCRKEILPQLDKTLRISGRKYHRKCFKCSQCGVDFPDKRFFMKDHLLFCEKDYAKRFCALCVACGEHVISGGLSTELGAFHAEHFNCTECGVNLARTGHEIVNKKQYCRKHKPAGPTIINCSGCGKIVDPRNGKRARHQWYHKECFKCSHCSVPLNTNNGGVYVHAEKIYCEEDFNLYHMKRCTKCCERINGKSSEANDEYYHPDCLKCDICDKKLEHYRTWGGLLRCAEHASTEVELICDMCDDEIPFPSEAVVASGLLLHKKCFKCVNCKSPLTKTSHRIDPLKGPMCLSCLEKSVKSDTKKDSSTPNGVTRSSAPGSLPTAVIQSNDLRYIQSPSKNFRPRPLSPALSPPQTPRSPRVPRHQNLSTIPRKNSERNLRSSPPQRLPATPNRRSRPAANTVGGVGDLQAVFNMFKKDAPKSAAQCISDILADSARSSISKSNASSPVSRSATNHARGRSIMGSGVRTRGKIGSGTASAGGSPRQSLSYREMQKSRRSAAQSTGGELASRTTDLLSVNTANASPRSLRAQITKNRRSRSVSSADADDTHRAAFQAKRSPFAGHTRNNQTYPRAPDPHSKALPDPSLSRGALASSPKSLSTGLIHSPRSNESQPRQRSRRKPFFKKSFKKSPTSEPRSNSISGSLRPSERSPFGYKKPLPTPGTPNGSAPASPSMNNDHGHKRRNASESVSSIAQEYLESMIKRQTAGGSVSVDSGSTSSYPAAFSKPNGSSIPARLPSPATAPKVGVLDTEDDDLTATRRRVGAVVDERSTLSQAMARTRRRLDVDGGAHGSIDAASNTDGGDDHLGDAAAAAGRHVRFTSRDNLKPLNLSSMTVSVSTDADLNKEDTAGLGSCDASPKSARFKEPSTNILSPTNMAKSAPAASGTSPQQQALHSILSGGNVDFNSPQFQTPTPQSTYSSSLAPQSSMSRSMSLGPPVTGNPRAAHSGGGSGGGGAHQRRLSRADAHREHVKAQLDNLDWRKGKMLGKGAFGVVYKGMITNTGEIVAVKQLILDSEEDLTAAAQIESEIEILTMLDHPNIVKVKGTQRKDDKLNIIMEYVPGNSISHIMGEYGALAEDTIRIYVYQILNALAYMHSQNVLHRDIKAKNILADTQGNCKLADFGSATVFEDMSVARQPSLNYNYTPLWTAPEVVQGAYGRKVDIWGLGCVIIEMATAKTPWHEKSKTERAFRNPFRILYYIGNSGQIPEIPSNLSAAGQDFVRQCLERDPDKRQDAQELLKHRWVEMCDVPGDELDYENGVSEGHGPSGATLEAVGTPQGGSHNRRRSIMNQDHIVRSTTPSFTKHRIPTPLHLG